MGKVRIYPPVKFIAAICYKNESILLELYARLESLLSKIDSHSETFPFQFTDYYSEEMGQNLKKKFVSFYEVIPVDLLPDIKLATNFIENEYKDDHHRTVNIDPGYICAAKLVLATTKDYDHRIYLNRGIFGDVHLTYRAGNFQPNKWTYPDYKQPSVVKYFEIVREKYLKQLSELNKLT